MRDALVAVLIAAHYTTALALAWALGEIAGRPEVVDHLAGELRRVTGGGPPEAGHLPALEYLDGAVRESLRLRPVAPFVVRKTVGPFAAGGRGGPGGVGLFPRPVPLRPPGGVVPHPPRFRAARPPGRGEG